MENTLLNPGEFKINLFQLTTRYNDTKIDLKNLVYALAITESMNLSNVRGNVTIIDSANVLNRFGICGEEIIQMIYQDALGNSQKLWLSLYAITDAKPNEQGTGMMYKLHFTSLQKYESDSRKVSKSYKGTVNEIAQNVYEEFFDVGKDRTKPFVLSDMEGVHQFVIPNLHPSHTMEFLARRSYSSSSATQAFKFWESRDAYHLQSLDDVVEVGLQNVLQYNYSPVSKNDGQGLAKRMSQVISLRFPNVVDSYSAMVGGRYKRSVRELDVIEQNVIKTDLEYSEIFDKVFSIGDERVQKHSKEFVENYLTKGDFTRTVIKDYSESDSVDGSGLRPSTFYPDIINHKGMVLDNLSDSQLVLKVYGRNDLKLGSIVALNIFENDGSTVDRKLDKRIGGKYMVETISHEFFEETFVQTVSLVRNDWGKV